jgi:hypothetical protein
MPLRTIRCWAVIGPTGNLELETIAKTRPEAIRRFTGGLTGWQVESVEVRIQYETKK